MTFDPTIEREAEDPVRRKWASIRSAVLYREKCPAYMPLRMSEAEWVSWRRQMEKHVEIQRGLQAARCEGDE